MFLKLHQRAKARQIYFLLAFLANKTDSNTWIPERGIIMNMFSLVSGTSELANKLDIARRKYLTFWFTFLEAGLSVRAFCTIHRKQSNTLVKSSLSPVLQSPSEGGYQFHICVSGRDRVQGAFDLDSHKEWCCFFHLI